MIRFITGYLEEIKVGATYEDVVYDRRLLLRLDDGRMLWVFDYIMEYGASEPPALHIGQRYSFVLTPLIGSAEGAFKLISPSETLSSNDTSLPEGWWQGRVVEMHWKAQKGDYYLAYPGFYEGEWVVLATSFGEVLLQYSDIESAEVGTTVQWKYSRIDLLAVK